MVRTCYAKMVNITSAKHQHTALQLCMLVCESYHLARSTAVLKIHSTVRVIVDTSIDITPMSFLNGMLKKTESSELRGTFCFSRLNTIFPVH